MPVWGFNRDAGLPVCWRSGLHSVREEKTPRKNVLASAQRQPVWMSLNRSHPSAVIEFMVLCSC